ncbi:hypothetical protein LCGC14_2430390 [marine sediment metagenome]|uniref:Uncharacterized protein n=1 Tax=marine sediment metagenome TaxID=412755 RepID=A0A0F9C9E5_9ZZZZ
MADAFYEEYRNGMLGGGVHAQPDMDTNDIRVGLRDEGTTALNLATQIDLADVESAHVGVDTALASLTVGSAGVGAFDHADETYPTLSGATVESLDYYDFQTASAATSPLIANIDGWTGLPFTPNGGDAILAPAAGGVFQIT